MTAQLTSVNIARHRDARRSIMEAIPAMLQLQQQYLYDDSSDRDSGSNDASTDRKPDNKVPSGQQVVLTATLSPLSSGSITADGQTLNFFNGSTSLGTGVLASGVATLNVTTLPVGTNSLTAVYAGDTNFVASTSPAVPFVVSKVTPVITWVNPVAITYGAALSATQLNATASVPGTFAYSPAVGVVLNAGTQTLNVTFTPT